MDTGTPMETETMAPLPGTIEVRPTAQARPTAAPQPLLPWEQRPGLAWWASVVLLAALVGFGLLAYSQQLIHGEVVTGMRTIGAGGATWGLYIIFAVFFIGVSFAGITVAAIIRLFDVQTLRSLSRLAELLTLVSLMMGGLCILADLGQPLKGLLYLPRYARTPSPFFGTFSLVMGGYLFSSLVYFYLAGRADAAHCATRAPRLRWLYRFWACGYRGTPQEDERHRRMSFWLALTIVPLLVTAHSTLGFVFGIQGGRPGWFGSLQGPGFVILAGVSGTGLLLAISALARSLLHLEAVVPRAAFRWLGNMLLVLTIIYLYMIIVEEVTANYMAPASETRVAHEVLLGAYAGLFWTAVGCLATAAGVLFVLFARGATSIGWTVTAGLLVNVAAILKRFLIVVPSQTHGMLLPYPTGSYLPSWVELGVVVGLLALGTLMFLVFARLFPLVSVAEHGGTDQTQGGASDGWLRGLLRRLSCWGSLATGLTLMVVGFLGASRVGTDPGGDPTFPFSPTIFIAGVVLSFSAAVLYEVIPGPRRPRPAV